MQRCSDPEYQAAAIKNFTYTAQVDELLDYVNNPSVQLIVLYVLRKKARELTQPQAARLLFQVTRETAARVGEILAQYHRGNGNKLYFQETVGHLQQVQDLETYLWVALHLAMGVPTKRTLINANPDVIVRSIQTKQEA